MHAERVDIVLIFVGLLAHDNMIRGASKMLQTHVLPGLLEFIRQCRRGIGAMHQFPTLMQQHAYSRFAHLDVVDTQVVVPGLHSLLLLACIEPNTGGEKQPPDEHHFKVTTGLHRRY